PYDSILGRRTDRVIETTRTFQPLAFDVASQDVRLGGTMVDVDAATGKAVAIRRICIREEQAATFGQPQNAPS
ncbi:MAG: metallophosphoesterase, partial [Planctomycetales bacterium]|nr:metallophosphoesterase [Planctomycetales bacterium]NIM08847.1 metallophosphoesterase [Planctomycetales bacterium]NIN08308.1 metallophosphoesterase [Planctomycetales bacterium]NIN77439.1 metallophosphoesterase [Planctomycetales bacterium]NIO34611.1 metallophosphoesterase [Planctomycetales bacterium]